MDNKIGTIYIATNLLNGKQYVGQTTRDLKERIKGHKLSASDKRNSSIFPRALKKYGINNFKWISFSCFKEDLDWQEQFLINELKTMHPNGYNLDSGGHANKIMGERAKTILSEKAKLRAYWVGDKNPKFNKGYLIKGKNNPNFGNKWTEEQRKHLSQIRITRGMAKGENNSNFGNKWTEEQRKHLSQIRITRGLAKGENNPNSKLAIITSPNKKEYSVSCIKTFCQEQGLCYGNILKVLRGQLKHNKGWMGRYVKNNK